MQFSFFIRISLSLVCLLSHKSLQKLHCLRPGADQSSKVAFGKSAFAKTCFLLLKIRLAHINRAKSKKAFEHVLARFSRKHFVCCTCQNVLENTFAFLLDWCAPVISLTNESTFDACFSKSAFAKSNFARLVCARLKIERGRVKCLLQFIPSEGPGGIWFDPGCRPTGLEFFRDFPQSI